MTSNLFSLRFSVARLTLSGLKSLTLKASGPPFRCRMERCHGRIAAGEDPCVYRCYFYRVDPA
jgi:hypothetical protein